MPVEIIKSTQECGEEAYLVSLDGERPELVSKNLLLELNRESFVKSPSSKLTRPFIPKKIVQYSDEGLLVRIYNGGSLIEEIDTQAPARFDTGIRFTTIFGSNDFTQYWAFM
jgi:hypothetical protein